ncbi:hypothetical protein GC167_09415 [bacterium]|nr:hypothetical protein [bacterium]
MKPTSEGDAVESKELVHSGISALLNANKSFACVRCPDQDTATIYVSDPQGPIGLRLRPFDLQLNPIDVPCRKWSGEAIDALPDFLPQNRGAGQQETAKSAYLDSGVHSLDQLRSGRMAKVVFSAVRNLRVQETTGLTAFNTLCQNRASDAVFWFRWKGIGEWMGSSPECLMQRSGALGWCDALAGTKPLDTPRLWTAKEVAEQQWVVDDVREKLARLDLSWTETASEREQGALIHRLTRFAWEVPDRLQNPSADGAVLEQFHPTPAVGGWPLGAALERIAAAESHQRRLYSGYFAVLEPIQTRAYVVLRCAEHTSAGWQAYAGGGWTADSVVEDEWTEIQLKMKLIQDAFES